MSSLYGISVWVLPLIFAINFHEARHGLVAHRLGDDTRLQISGRVSFNRCWTSTLELSCGRPRY